MSGTSHPKFVHLRLHSEYSIVDGIVRIKNLLASARQQQMPAVAITDHCNLFGTVKFYSKALSSGIKPIIGSDIYLKDFQREHSQPARLTLLCQDNQGYLNLLRIISKAYQQGQIKGSPFVDKSWLHGFCDGLIALSGGLEGDIAQALLAGDKAKRLV